MKNFLSKSLVSSDINRNQQMNLKQYLKIFCFCSYMALFICQGLLVTASKDHNNSSNKSISYSISLAVLSAEETERIVGRYSFTGNDSINADFNHQYKPYFRNRQNVTTILFIIVQIFSSCLAGVYNEYLLKNTKLSVSCQNIFMYFDSSVLNLLLLLNDLRLLNNLPGNDGKTLWLSEVRACVRPIVMVTIFNNILIGIVTSYFLKYLNVILKAFASALEIILTAILANLFFNIEITTNTVLAIFIVSTALWMYTKGSSKQSDSNTC
ncbi:hypothetical protein GJ496_000753 [Pomphorhynchus laevis]|nr:hypothetical protein GJ496_000753 [Pomphorhynchus laevis]